MINNATNIIIWNANGLSQHKHELHNFLIQNNIHIACITETHLTKTLKLKLPGYSIYRADHPDDTTHAGSAIIIATNLVHNLHSISPQINLQSVSIQIFLNYFPSNPCFNLLFSQQKNHHSRFCSTFHLTRE